LRQVVAPTTIKQVIEIQGEVGQPQLGAGVKVHGLWVRRALLRRFGQAPRPRFDTTDCYARFGAIHPVG